MERAKLLRRVENAPRVLVYPGSSDYDANVSLLAQGRLTQFLVPDDESETGDSYETHITDLGRLALRVCPVDEF